MKALLCAITLLLLASYSFGQKVPHIYQIRADTVRIYNTCDTAEFVLENRTKDTLGFLFNKGKGRTEFRRLSLERIGASQLAIKGQDTIDLNFSGFGDTRYDLLSTNFVTIPSGDSLLFAQWPNMKVVGYDAYSSPDMPALSRQAIQGMGNKTYYNGLVVRDDNSGFDFAVNWDGELNGPNGAFLRTKDDTKLAWSKWRELLFKDYADTTYAPRDAETLQSVMARGNSTGYNIVFGGTAASSPGLYWGYNTDAWKIFVESPQDTPAGDMIFESIDNQQEGWVFRTNNATSTAPTPILNIQPEGTFTYKGNNILHEGNHPAGAAFSPTLTGANVLSGITTNAAGHVTALTTRALTLADIGAAPATTSGNYIQNLAVASGTQTANFSINGTGNAATGFSSPLLFSNNSAGQLNLVGGATGASSLRGGEIVLLGGSYPNAPGEILFRTGTGGSGAQQPERMRITAAGNLGIGTATPAARLDVSDPSTAANTTDAILSRFIGDANFRLEARKGIVANTAGGVATKFGLTYNGAENAMINFHRGAGTTNGFMSFSTGNGTERMRIDGTGYVGIGTAAPFARLTVSGNSSNELVVMNTGAFAGNSGAFARFYNTGTPGAANQVIGGIMMGSNPSAGVYRIAAQIQAISDTAWTDGTSHPSNLVFYTVPKSGIIPFEAMRIAPNGYVGINKSSPTEALDVMGKGKFSAGITAPYITSGGNSAFVLIGGNFFDYRGAQLDLYAGNNTTNTGMMLFRTGTGSGSSPQPERMRITGTGNLLVGTTVDGGQKLQVFGTTSTQKVIVTTPTAYDITHNNQSIAKDATTNELVPYDGNIADFLTLSASTTLSTAEYYIKSNSAAYTVTVPSAAANPGRVYVIKNSGGTTSDITLNVATNAQTIDGVGTNIAITPGAWIRIVSNGTAWFKVGG